MNVKEAYNLWASQYDTNNNRTRDLEAAALRKCLQDVQFFKCLEIGCGTGKNTEWLVLRASEITAVDLSDEMLARAREKVDTDKVRFIQADITKEWSFVQQPYDLITFSLVLEHIEDLADIFKKAGKAAKSKGLVYIGELHPFKQYTGTKARFETAGGQQVVPCFTHNISDFTGAAQENDFEILDIAEYFDDNDRTGIPRIITLLLRKK